MLHLRFDSAKRTNIAEGVEMRKDADDARKSVRLKHSTKEGGNRERFRDEKPTPPKLHAVMHRTGASDQHQLMESMFAI